VGSSLEEYTLPEDIIEHLDKFVRTWATDLCKVTQGKPLPKDYGNYARSIVKKYPFLRSSICSQENEG